MEIVGFIVYFFAFICLFFGLRAFKMNNSFFKALFFQVILYTVFFSSVFILQRTSNLFGIHFSNLVLVNIHVGAEAFILFVAALSILKDPLERKTTFGIMILFVLIFVSLLLYYGPYEYIQLTDVAACFSLTIVYSMVLNRIIRINKQESWKTPELLASVGLLVYFGGSVPFVSMTNFLSTTQPELYSLLFDIINVGLANIRYLLLALAFIFIYRARGKNQLQF